ncbi:MAG TPA: FAD-binding oxidoreductase [Planctomycetaceae bacterium]|nr:FAD-binding oxidoreductase [Planctomycetaceae bacterium]
MPTRREVLKVSARMGLGMALPSAPLFVRAAEPDGIEVNDVQSQLNSTRVHEIRSPRTVSDLQIALRDAQRQNRAISLAGGRHAMGGQQFGSDAMLLDTKDFNHVVGFDKAKGQITVEAGIEWPELIDFLQSEQAGQKEAWAIREKQTGVDRVTLGGSLASNVHGRGLKFPPIVGDVESFTLLGADGKLQTCSRNENQELFSLAIGGYGLFGIIVHVTLRLVHRTKVQRIVEIIPVKDLLPSVEKRLASGFVYGDCQYSTDLDAQAEAHAGVFSCYRPVPLETPIPPKQKQLGDQDWIEFYKLARTDKKKAFEKYSKYYLSTNEQVYWSDTNQLAGSFDAYRNAVDKQRGTEMITEAYVNRDNFIPFMAKVRQDYIDHGVDMTFGTIRFIEKDNETFLAWAKEPSVCIVCNLHVVHTDEGKQKAADDFRRIIDRAIEFGGRYYLTYHRWATRKQVEACYPQFVDFLRLKKKYDPQERFQSDWYRHYKKMFADKV